MPSLAYAQSTPGAAAPGPLVSLMPIALMFVVLYFLLIRPQQKRAREHETTHRYSLEEFGLQGGEIRAELVDLFERFGWDAAADAAAEGGARDAVGH